jgi:hypothetical protein
MGESVQTLDRSTAEAYAGVAIGLCAAVIPMTWWIRGALLALVAAIIIDLIVRSPWTNRWSKRPKIFLATSAIGLLIAASWRPIWEDFRGPINPDVKLYFVHPSRPAVVLWNDSDVVANTVIYSFALWNLDSPLNDLKTPLQVLSAKADYIRANQAAGPNAIFDTPAILSRLKKGNRIFGVVSVSCPQCLKRRQYWFNASWEKGGWYSEILQEAGQVNLPKIFEILPLISKDTEAFFRDVPPNQRKEIAKSIEIPK